MRDRIIEAMRKRGIYSMAELERKSGVPSGTLRNMGQGHMPSMEKVNRIATYLGVSVDYIVNGGEETPEIKTEPKPLKEQRPDPIREFFTLVASLNDQNMEALLDYVRYLASKQERD